MKNATQQAFMALLFGPSSFQPINHYLVLNVTRDNIVADTVRELLMVNSRDLKKPLRVEIWLHTCILHNAILISGKNFW